MCWPDKAFCHFKIMSLLIRNRHEAIRSVHKAGCGGKGPSPSELQANVFFWFAPLVSSCCVKAIGLCQSRRSRGIRRYTQRMAALLTPPSTVLVSAPARAGPELSVWACHLSASQSCRCSPPAAGAMAKARSQTKQITPSEIGTGLDSFGTLRLCTDWHSKIQL